MQEKAKLRRAREKAKQKALLRKQQQQSEELPESTSSIQPESLSNIAIAIDPTYSPRKIETYEASSKHF